MTEINTWAIYVLSVQLEHNYMIPTAYIDLLVVEPLFQIVIDSLIRDCAKKRHVPYTSLLFLSQSFRPVRLHNQLTILNTELVLAYLGDFVGCTSSSSTSDG